VAIVGYATINQKSAATVMEMVVVVAVAHKETVVAVVAEAEADDAENGSSAGIDIDSG
jgi:hypothetical protein